MVWGSSIDDIRGNKGEKKHSLPDNSLLLRIMKLYRCFLNSGETGKLRDYDPLPVGYPTELPHGICIIQSVNDSADHCTCLEQSAEKSQLLTIKFPVDKGSAQEKPPNSKSGLKLNKSPLCSIRSEFQELVEVFSSFFIESLLNLQRKTRKHPNQSNQEKLKFCLFQLFQCLSKSKHH